MTDIKKVTVLGAGVMGAQIAFQAANRGFDVISWDINDDALKAAKDRFDSFSERYVKEVDDATEDSVREARERLQQSSDLPSAVKDADVVIEAVPERMDIKKDVWTQVGDAAPDHAIFSSNSSTLLPSDFADFSKSPERFLNFHFINNIWVLNAVEIMPHEGTEQQYIDTMMEFGKELGMEPVLIKREKNGYVFNSLLRPWLDAAQELWAEGYAEIEDVDKDWRVGTGAPMGPFEFMDMIGLRTLFAIIDNDVQAGKAPEWKVKFRDTLKDEYIDKGRLGWESGKGFYDNAGDKAANLKDD